MGRDLVERLIVHEDLSEALSEFSYVVGTTARQGSKRGPFTSPRKLARELIGLSREHRIGLLFGPERTGLTTAELRLCQAVVRIPTANPRAASLNLAQAVLILGYEIMMAQSDEPAETPIKLATSRELRDMYDHLKTTLLEIRFLPDENTEHWLMSFKRLFNRTGLTHGECNLIRGLCRQIKWAVEHLPGQEGKMDQTSGRRDFNPGDSCSKPGAGGEEYNS